MGTISDIARREQARKSTPSPALAARILTTPGALDETVDVEILSQPGYRRGPCPWPQGAVTPQADDKALVIEADDGRLWVVAFWSETP